MTHLKQDVNKSQSDAITYHQLHMWHQHSINSWTTAHQHVILWVNWASAMNTENSTQGSISKSMFTSQFWVEP